MTRVWFSTNYSMSTSRELVDAGVYPSHFLYGALGLEAAGISVEYGPFASSKFASSVTRWTRQALGNLGDEVRVLRGSDPGDVAYSADHHTFRGLGVLRARSSGPLPVVTVFHHIPDDRVFRRAALVGPDTVICLSALVAEALVDLGRGAGVTVVAPWGPDLSFPGYTSTGTEAVVSCGKTNRDLSILLPALARLDCKGIVYMNGAAEPIPRNVDAVGVPVGEALHRSFTRALADLARASVVAVPLRDPRRLSGLSELNDALALGKPVVMTRSPLIDVDIEAIGCGVWVDDPDPDAWAEALTYVLADEARRSAMGNAGRVWAERHWNASVFNRVVVETVTSLAG